MIPYETFVGLLPGCVELWPRVQHDARGRFVKTFHQPGFDALGLNFVLAEEFVSTSKAGVLRGLHFQAPPHDHVKIVYCASGKAWDVVFDLRIGSPTYGRHQVTELDAERGNVLYIPAGLAHGFCVPDGEATMVYKVSAAHSPEHDLGIRWDTAGIAWPVADPILSERDRSFPALDGFDSPFRYLP